MCRTNVFLWDYAHADGHKINWCMEPPLSTLPMGLKHIAYPSHWITTQALIISSVIASIPICHANISHTWQVTPYGWYLIHSHHNQGMN